MRARVWGPAFAALVVLLALAPYAWATPYRYWSFWQGGGDGGWGYAQGGPAMTRPDDGDVEGWRFAVSQDNADRAKVPRGTADFDAICRDVPTRRGTKRVGIVIDFGTASDTPGGKRPPRPGVREKCARVPVDATSADTLAAVARPLRYDTNALLCAIAGYPDSGCGEAATTPSGRKGSGAGRADGTRGGKTEDDGPSLGLLASGAAVATLATAAVWRARRR